MDDGILRSYIKSALGHYDNAGAQGYRVSTKDWDSRNNSEENEMWPVYNLVVIIPG
jgi:hypothetical protein